MPVVPTKRQPLRPPVGWTASTPRESRAPTVAWPLSPANALPRGQPHAYPRICILDWNWLDLQAVLGGLSRASTGWSASPHHDPQPLRKTTSVFPHTCLFSTPPLTCFCSLLTPCRAIYLLLTKSVNFSNYSEAVQKCNSISWLINNFRGVTPFFFCCMTYKLICHLVLNIIGRH